MRDFDDHERRSMLETLLTSLTMLAFGLGILAFLIAIDRADWFVIRPASGTATAMSMASNASHGPEAQP